VLSMKKSSASIQYEYIQSLKVSRYFDIKSSFHSMGNLFEERKRIAERILKYGETEDLKDAFIYINRMIFIGLGLFVDDN
jgi:hypothetical protein